MLKLLHWKWDSMVAYHPQLPVLSLNTFPFNYSETAQGPVWRHWLVISQAFIPEDWKTWDLKKRRTEANRIFSWVSEVRACLCPALAPHEWPGCKPVTMRWKAPRSGHPAKAPKQTPNNQSCMLSAGVSVGFLLYSFVLFQQVDEWENYECNHLAGDIYPTPW